MAEQQKVVIQIPKWVDEDDRASLAEDIIDYISIRTGSGKDRFNKKFRPYSKEYAKEKGVGTGEVDLILSGDLLESLLLLDQDVGQLVIGYEEGDEINGKAEGNITGSYGQPDPNPKKARDYLGISRRDLAELVEKYR